LFGLRKIMYCMSHNLDQSLYLHLHFKVKVSMPLRNQNCLCLVQKYFFYLTKNIRNQECLSRFIKKYVIEV